MSELNPSLDEKLHENAKADEMKLAIRGIRVIRGEQLQKNSKRKPKGAFSIFRRSKDATQSSDPDIQEQSIIPHSAFRIPDSGRRLRQLMLCLAASLAAAFGFLWLFFFSASGILPSFEKVREDHTGSDALLLDRNGSVIHELRVDRSRRQLEWVSLDEMSPVLISAVLAAEDKRFYDHKGVDWISFGGAAVGLVRNVNTRGASTITMQLASKLIPDLQPRNVHRSLWQKSAQIRRARALEMRWSKEQILEAYLNLVTFRGELQGIAAAARGLYSKKPHGLDNIEALILAALIRSPNASIDLVIARACALSDILGTSMPQAGIQAKVLEALARPYFVPPQASLAPHVALRLLKPGSHGPDKESRRIRCTLDSSLQSFASETLKHHLLSLKSQNMHDGAILVVDNTSGDILAYVGNSGGEASARYVDGIQAPRQAGSTLKPFVYGVAFEQRLLTPASLLEDSALDVPVLGGIYRPRNYDNQFHGIVTARTALASSLNVPAVKTLNLAGIGLVIDSLARFGFRNLRSSDFYGPSLALGAADITLWDLVNAYRSLANGGICAQMRLTFDAPHPLPSRALSRETAFLLSDILSDRESRSATFGLESPLATRFWTAVKTGTSKDMRDNWCVGYSSLYTVGVWTGNFSGEPMWNVSGVTGAAPAWVEIMNHLHSVAPSTAPVRPPGVVQRSIRITATEEMRQEYFIKGTDMAVIQSTSGLTGSRIIYPVEGAVIALDPDIPPDQQRLFFESQPDDDTLSWVLDGRVLGPAASIFLWPPASGKHRLVLADASNHELDSVSFEVRGISIVH